MTVEYFREGKSAYDFIVAFFSVYKFVSSKTIYTSHVAPNENKKCETTYRTVNPVFENLVSIIYPAWIATTYDTQAPNPSYAVA